ncbi:MAG TPA: recombinase family protein [Desulfotomaculum sp.]|nr:recombinase family protein [Desulfotomaculum sp.]
MQAVAYIRVSTDEQAKEGYSVPAQKERLEAFAKSQGWTIIDYYMEEGQSAKDLNRPEMQRLIDDIKKGSMGIEVVLVYRLDRLTRSVLDLYKLLKLFDDNKVAFRSVTEVYDTTTAMGRLFITLVAALAQWERENLAERVRMGMAEMARQGRRPGTKEPYGYNYVDGSLIVNKTEAAIVKKIFDMYMRGYGLRTIVKWLNNPEHPVPSKTGRPWYENTVSYIITNPLYVGKFVWGRDPAEIKKHKTLFRAVAPEYIYDGSHEAILDNDTWEQAQFKLKKRKNMPPRLASSNYPLTGVLKCGLCGAGMCGSISTQKNKSGKRKVRWYKCGARDHALGCTMKYMRAETVEEKVLEYLSSITNSSDLHILADTSLRDKGNSKEQEEIASVNKEIKELTAKKKKWYDAFEVGVIGIDDLRERTKSIADKEVFLRERLSEIELVEEFSWTPEERFQMVKNINWAWDRATPEERKELIRELFEKISIFPTGEMEYEFI